MFSSVFLFFIINASARILEFIFESLRCDTAFSAVSWVVRYWYCLLTNAAVHVRNESHQRNNTEHRPNPLQIKRYSLMYFHSQCYRPLTFCHICDFSSCWISLPCRIFLYVSFSLAFIALVIHVRPTQFHTLINTLLRLHTELRIASESTRPGGRCLKSYCRGGNIGHWLSIR